MMATAKDITKSDGTNDAAGLELTTAANVTEIVVTGVTGGYFANTAAGTCEMLARGFILLLKQEELRA